MSMSRSLRSGRLRLQSGFTLIEMIVVVMLLAIAMLGILAVFDASARINKSEQDVADAQGAVRYGIYQMTRAIRMAGAGGLFVTQAVLNRPDPDLAGITVGSANGYDNVTGASVRNLAGTLVPVRDGTDMIEIRGVINSPLLGFDLSSGCGTCTGTSALLAKTITFSTTTGRQHVNDDAAQRPQFAAIDAYTAGATATNTMLVLVSGNDDIHGGCSVPFGPQQYSQPTYNVGAITAPTNLLGATPTFGTVNFADGVAVQFNSENPANGAVDAHVLPSVRRAGILDDWIYFIDNSDPNHPALAQGIRRGSSFDVVTLADDVEDMQIAYGVDTNGNSAINRLLPAAGNDTDLNVSNQVDGDEWVPNVPGENTPYTTGQFQSDAAAVAAGFPHAGSAIAHCPRLHGVMVSLVAKSKDPDPTYRAPASVGFRVMNTPVTVAPPIPDVARYPALSTEPHFRRRIQTLKINLRNYAFEG